MLTDYVDPKFLSIIKAKREDGTLVLAAASLVILGLVLGGVAAYDHFSVTLKDKKLAKSENE